MALDPEIADAFSTGSTQSTPARAIDPEIADAFSSADDDGGLSPVRMTATRAAPMPSFDPNKLQQFDPSQIRAYQTGLTPSPLDLLVDKAVSYVTGLPKKGGDWLQAYARAHGVENPYAQAAIGELPQLGANVAASIAPFGAAGKGEEVAESAVNAAHPLAQAAEQEGERIAALKSVGEARGLDLPIGGSQARHAQAAANNQPIVNAMGREDLRLPPNAPLTPQMLAKGREVYGSPAYKAVQNLKDPIPLDDAYAKDIEEARTSNMNASPSERLPLPAGDSLTGAQAVDFSKKARFLANSLEKNPQNPFAAQDAQMYRDAAQAVEDAVERHLQTTGQGQLSKDWDAARVYYAKSYSYEHSLDGAGNVKAADLKSQLLKGRPLSDNSETVANLAAMHPQAFRLAPEGAPRPGLIRRGAAALLPHVGTGIGGSVGGTPGSIIGNVVGEHVADKILPP